jgi:hypothetical protein
MTTGMVLLRMCVTFFPFSKQKLIIIVGDGYDGMTSMKFGKNIACVLHLLSIHCIPQINVLLRVFLSCILYLGHAIPALSVHPVYKRARNGKLLV